VSCADAKRLYATASIVNAERIVFNIKGNDYRLVVSVDFEKGIVWIKWIGTHKAYDKIDVTGSNMATDLKPIRTEADCENALVEVERLWGAKIGTPEGDRLNVLATLIDVCEARHHPIDPPDPIGAIGFRMEQQSLTRKDLEPMIGPRNRVADVLNGKRSLSIEMIGQLHDRLGILADVLIGSSRIDEIA
jgi:HTH-type transcriptional regulator/antitoxin HigA